MGLKGMTPTPLRSKHRSIYGYRNQAEELKAWVKDFKAFKARWDFLDHILNVKDEGKIPDAIYMTVDDAPKKSVKITMKIPLRKPMAVAAELCDLISAIRYGPGRYS